MTDITRKKLINSLKNGTLIGSIHLRLRFIKRIKNVDTFIRFRQDKIYYKYKKKYERIIKEGADTELEKKRNNIIWFCWFQGIENAPDIVKACYQSIKRGNLDFEIVVITAKNYGDYVSVPSLIIEKWKKGIISYAHFSDILRLELLVKHGGWWIDSSVYCTAQTPPQYIVDNDFFVYKVVELARLDSLTLKASSWMIYSTSSNPILMLTLKLIHEYWSSANHLEDYFLFHILFSLAVERYPKLWNDVPVFNNVSPHILQFEATNTYDEERWNQIVNFSDFHKLNWRAKFETDSFYYKMIGWYKSERK